MQTSELNAISPVDGRYKRKVDELSSYFSEFALFKYRIQIEIEYFIALCEANIEQLKNINHTLFPAFRNIYQNFDEFDALMIKDIEKTTNHDVKAVEYFVKEKLNLMGIESELEFIHFGLTSQDINNTAIPLSIKNACVEILFPSIEKIISTINEKANEWENVPMLARTHGQPASPTRLGKELKVFAIRLQKQLDTAKQIPYAAKFGGATGNFNAHFIAYPNIDWNSFAKVFVEENLGLARSYPTTQIEHYDFFAAWCDALKRINTILLDFCRDIWTYISLDYFKQKIKVGEVGSSAMPHKVNPIDFENAEGNLGIANALFEHFSAKLPISRLQRDLTDSTVLRNVGVPVAHMLISLKAIETGMQKLLLHQEKINADLENNWAVVAEAVQTILRREGYPKPYETLKDLTRTNQVINQENLHAFIDKLDVNETIKTELKQISPFNYTGQ
jgi:adenylosuccinate lyase